MVWWQILLIVIGVLAFLGIIIGLIVWWFKIYNQLVKNAQRVKNGWSQIEVQLKKRFDLVPNLVETVKGYASHEADTLKEVTKWRSKVAGAGSQEEVMDANNGLGNAISRLLVSVEKYPDLKANTNFLQLQADLKDIESKIAYARQFYNDTVQKNNELIEMFPSSLVARRHKTKFTEAQFFKAEEAVYEAPKVQF